MTRYTGFVTISPRNPLNQFCLNFIWSLLRLGEQKIAEMVMAVETYKNLPLQNLRCLGAESLHKSSGMGDLPKLLK